MVFHKNELNSLEVRTLLRWLDDYLAHYDLFYFKALSDDGLDIVYNVVLDVPTYVPPLALANFIPQNVSLLIFSRINNKLKPILKRRKNLPGENEVRMKTKKKLRRLIRKQYNK